MKTPKQAEVYAGMHAHGEPLVKRVLLPAQRNQTKQIRKQKMRKLKKCNYANGKYQCDEAKYEAEGKGWDETAK